MSPNSDPSNEAPLFPNIFALPSQTTILATILVAVMFATMAGISANAPIAVFWPLTISLLALSLRELLAWPERELRKLKAYPAEAHHSIVQRRIGELATFLNLKRPPQLWLVPDPFQAQALGPLYRRYLLVGTSVADNMAEKLADPSLASMVDALLLHELAHFQHGDNVRIGYTRALLRTGGFLIGWAALFLVGWILLLIVAQRDIFSISPLELADRSELLMPDIGLRKIVLTSLPSVEEWQQAREKAGRINLNLVLLYVVGNTFPVAMGSGMFLVVLWRKLLRTREYYADAVAVHLQGTITPLLRMPIRLFSQRLAISSKPDTSWLVRRRDLVAKWLQAIGRQKKATTRSTAILERAFATHPTPEQLETALKDPATIYDGWAKSGWLFGFAILAFEQLMMGTSAFFYFSEWPMHMLVVPAFLLVSLTLMVRVALNGVTLRDTFKIMVVILTPHTILLLFILAGLWFTVLVAPTRLASFFDSAASFFAGFTGILPKELLSDPATMSTLILQATAANLIQPPIMLMLAVAALELTRRLIARTLTWYGHFNAVQDWKRCIYRLVGLLTLALAGGILVPATDLALLRFEKLAQPLHLALFIVGITSGVIVAVWFINQDRRYARRCPHCAELVSGNYSFGQRCPSCAALLNPWLTISYDIVPPFQMTRVGETTDAAMGDDNATD